jgi:prepilin-type N-terminal cleavage/methylation domain-containing protein
VFHGNNKSAQSGFTLLELIVTLLVASTLSALTVPTVGNLLHQTRLNRVSGTLQSDIAFARTEAIKRREAISVAITDEQWVQGWSVFVDGNSDGDIDTGEEVIREFLPTYNTNGTGVQSTHDADSFTFSDRGAALSAGGVAFTSSNSNVTVKTVRIEYVGTPDICISSPITPTICIDLGG